jgi:hypothetical protein
VPDGIEEASIGGGSWWSCGEREYFLAGTAPPGGGCGFRAMADGRLDDWRESGEQLKRMILDRIRAEIEAGRQRR